MVEDRLHVARRAALGLRCLALLLVLAAWPRNVGALEPGKVPAPLAPWVPWVLEELGDQLCPGVGHEAQCVWPGRLELVLGASGGSFRLHVVVDRFARVELPGADKAWPQDVTVNRAAVAVLAEDGVPVVSLQRGSHVVEGRFHWSRLPETLAVPELVALIELNVLGQRVALPRRDAQRLWLKGDQLAVEEPESLTLEVFRKLTDDVPFRVETELTLKVSGKARELALPRVLPEGALPVGLSTKLPARLERNGDLLLQVYPGQHAIAIEALYPTPPERLSAPAAPPPWPNEEVWVFEPKTEQRQVQIPGELGIDPARTNLPQAWRSLAAYRLASGGALSFETLRRGQATSPPNRVMVQRDLWLDLDGQGYTVRDQITGSLSRSWRLDLLEGELGHVSANSVDQLITLHPESGARGVELRQRELNLTAEWRLPEATQGLPAVAWSENVEQLSSTLFLPPGWELLTVSGVDSVSQTWLSRWNLFALFYVLVVAIAVARLDRPVWGGLALLALVIAHEEPDAPHFSWGVVLLSIALLHGLPAGRFRQLVRVIAVVAGCFLLWSTLSFSVSQIRAALYPQAAQGYGLFDMPPPRGRSSPSKYEMAETRPEGGSAKVAAPDPDQELHEDMVSSAVADAYRQKGRSGYSLAQDPHALIQTGPSVPSWNWKWWQLGWSGPVDQAHRLQVYLISPRVNGVLSALRILLIGALTFWALRLVLLQARPPRPPRVSAPAAALLLVPLCLLASAFYARPAHADIPSPELLQELKERLAPPEGCVGNCVEVPRLEIEVQAGTLRVSAEVHAGARGSYQLPGPARSWLPTRVAVDGREPAPLRLGADGFFYVRLDAGPHRVRAEGPILGRDLTLEPGKTPRFVRVNAPGWEVTGLSDNGQIDGALSFLRKEPASASEPASATALGDAAALPTFGVLTRSFDLGVSWSVSSELKRVGPKGTLMLVKVPLLPGERVTSADVPSEGGFASVRLLADADSASFNSVLEPRAELALTAPAAAAYNERWVLGCGPIFRCDAEGIAPIQHEANGVWQPTFAPWPGESLRVRVARPAAAVGQTATIDNATLELKPGVRLLRAELEAALRLSTQTTYELELPEGAEVDSLSVDGRTEPIRQDGNRLKLVLAPGSRTLRASWQEPGGMSTWFKTPTVRLGQALSNARVSVHLPEERWLLAAGGPAWGPAILYWGHLVLILLLAPVLARLPRSPLQAWQWALLALGLTQVPLPVAGIVFGWFFLIAWSDVGRPERPLWFNLRQFGLIAVTLVFLGCLFGAVYDSLLNTPDMEVTGGGSNNRLLSWYVDRTAGELPEAWVLSTSLWVWRGVMLAWALWLASNLVRWLKWAWFEASAAGIWKPWRKARA
jgi:hypothetical protein